MLALIKFIVGLIAAVVVIGVGGAYLLPGEASFSRSTVINAPPDKVFALVSDLDRFGEWSPWADLDPAMTIVRSGPKTGVGSRFAWASNDPSVGAGSMTVTEVTPPESLRLALDFGEMGKSESGWRFVPEAAGTRASWSFHMKLDGVIDRWMGLLMERFAGPDYEKGLARLKTLAEKENPGG
jgi:uncharacterized protein YndB with AHSA1/START domain